MQTSNTPSKSHSRAIHRYVIGAVVAALLLTAMAVDTNDISASSEPDVLLGCVGTMVISNVDCEMGVATVYPIDLSNGLAPWCNGQIDMTIYGCFDSSDTDRPSVREPERVRRVRCHQHVATLHPDGAMRASQNPCEDDVWVDEVLVRLADNHAETQRCLALTNPGQACTP